jgi:hypothetical protein
MKRLKPWPIVAGILIDTFGSFGLGIFYFIGVFGLQIVRGAPPGDDSLTVPHLIVLEILGLFLTAVGGFAAARMARTLHIQHGIAVGVGALVVWLFLEWAVPSEGLPAWYEIVSFAGVVPAGALGGYAAAQRAHVPLQPTSGDVQRVDSKD